MSKLSDLKSSVDRSSEVAARSSAARFDSVDKVIPQVPGAVIPAVAPETSSATQEVAQKPVEPVKKITLALPESIWKTFRHRCTEEGRTGQDILMDLIEEYLEKH